MYIIQLAQQATKIMHFDFIIFNTLYFLSFLIN